MTRCAPLRRSLRWLIKALDQRHSSAFLTFGAPPAGFVGFACCVLASALKKIADDSSRSAEEEPRVTDKGAGKWRPRSVIWKWQAASLSFQIRLAEALRDIYLAASIISLVFLLLTLFIFSYFRWALVPGCQLGKDVYVCMYVGR